LPFALQAVNLDYLDCIGPRKRHAGKAIHRTDGVSIRLKQAERDVLAALFGAGEGAQAGYRNWRRRVNFDDVEQVAATMLPLPGRGGAEPAGTQSSSRVAAALRAFRAVVLGHDLPPTAGQGVSSRDLMFAGVDGFAYQLMPSMVEAAQRHAPDDPDLPRMRGIAKSLWLRNTFRMRTLLDLLGALEKRGVPAVLMKGAAMFARDSRRMAARCTHDFDVLIGRDGINAAIEAITAKGFRQPSVHADRFEAADFQSMHAVVVEREPFETFDLHWWPTPHLQDQNYVDELFDHAETLLLFGRPVRVVSLADHLALSTMRAHGDRLQWLLDSHWLLSAHGDRLDWSRFVEIIVRRRSALCAATYLKALQQVTGDQIPASVFRDLKTRLTPFERIERIVTEVELFNETPVKKLIGHVSWIISEAPRPAAMRTLPRLAAGLVGDSLARSHLRNAWRTMRRKERRLLPDFWRMHAHIGTEGPGDRPVFGEGWSLPESTGRWSNQRFAAVAIPVDAAKGATCLIEAVVRPFLPPPNKTFRIRYTTDGLTERDWTFDATSAFPCLWRFEADAIGAVRKHVLLAMELLDAAQPIKLGLSADLRLLGIQAESLRQAPLSA
jgi:hypothetical protein